MTPKRAKNTQSSPNLANVCLHIKEAAFANFPIHMQLNNDNNVQNNFVHLTTYLDIL